MPTSPILYYFHDPMCSWCWGFRPVWLQVKAAIGEKIDIRYVLGGLAADTDRPMPESMRSYLQQTWKKIQHDIPGTQFNFDFWSHCLPRRSTYPSCRAIIATRMQAPDRELDMLHAIQLAYYLQARNPSDIDVLIQIAYELGLDTDRFESDIRSVPCQLLLEDELAQCRDYYVESFPSLVLVLGNEIKNIHIDYTQADTIVDQIECEYLKLSQHQL